MHYLIFALFSGVTISGPRSCVTRERDHGWLPCFFVLSLTEEQLNQWVIIILMETFSEQPLLPQVQSHKYRVSLKNYGAFIWTTLYNRLFFHIMGKSFLVWLLKQIVVNYSDPRLD